MKQFLSRFGRRSVDHKEWLFGCVTEDTPRFRARTLRLVQSLRWFGGSFAPVPFLVCAVEGIDEGTREELEGLGAEVRVVDRVHRGNPMLNKLAFYEEATVGTARQLLLVDCDIVFVADPAPHLRSGVVQAKIADLPTVSHQDMRLLCSEFGIPLPSLRYRTTFRGEPTIAYCNAGVVATSRPLAERFVPLWRDFADRVFEIRDRLTPAAAKHTAQAGFALALAALKPPFVEGPLAINFPTHLTSEPAMPEVGRTDPALLHYHDSIDDDGCMLSVPWERAQRRIETFNERWRGRK